MNYPIQVLTKERDDLQMDLNFANCTFDIHGAIELKAIIVQLDKAIERETKQETGEI